MRGCYMNELQQQGGLHHTGGSLPEGRKALGA